MYGCVRTASNVYANDADTNVWDSESGASDSAEDTRFRPDSDQIQSRFRIPYDRVIN